MSGRDMASEGRPSSGEGQSSTFLKEVGDKKRNLRRIAAEVGNMAVDLQNVRSRAAAQEAAMQQEAGKRQVAEAHARDLAQQLETVQKSLEDARSEAQSSASIAEQSLKELMDATERLSDAEEINDVATAAATSFRHQCETLARELEQKDCDLQQQRALIEILEQQVAELEEDTKQKETAEQQLRHQIQKLEAQIEMSKEIGFPGKECEFQKLLNEAAARNIKHLEKHLQAKDDEITRLRQELEKQQTADREAQEKIIKLEFCLSEAQRQIRKLRKIVQKEQGRQNSGAEVWLQDSTASADSKPGFWSNLRVPGLLSMSAVALVCLVKK